MSDKPVAKRSVLNAVGEKIYEIMFKPGWQRWVLLAVAALVFVLAALQLAGGTSYKDDPSALVPRSSQIYLETRDLDSLLKNVAAWKLWRPERRAKGDEQRNQLQVDVAGLIGDQVAGLGTRLPLLWLVDAKQAAYCVSRDEQGVESWALFLRAANSGEVLADIGVEPGMNIETVKGTPQQGVFKLTGTGNGELFFAVIDPWLIVSSQATLPEFAFDSSRRPAFSLSRAGILPNWRHGVAIRGLVNPIYQADQSTSAAYGLISKWMDPDVRVSFTSKIGRKGLETLSDADQLSERVRGSGLWPIFAVLLAILGLIALFIIFAIILIMVGWGGWLKTLALRAGVTSVKSPQPAEPSKAFAEDSGALSASAKAAPVEEAKSSVSQEDTVASVESEPVSAPEKVATTPDPVAPASSEPAVDVEDASAVEGQAVDSSDVPVVPADVTDEQSQPGAVDKETSGSSHPFGEEKAEESEEK